MDKTQESCVSTEEGDIIGLSDHDQVNELSIPVEVRVQVIMIIIADIVSVRITPNILLGISTESVQSLLHISTNTLCVNR